MELGKKIRQLRFKAGLTQEQLGEKLGVGAQAVSKWETAAAMPDITLLPKIAETFGVSIDDLFELTVEQRFNRIENRMDCEEELPADVFNEYEEFLRAQYSSEKHKKRAAELLAYLYWHRMHACAQKVKQYAKEAIRRDPGVKGCQWMLQMAEGHAAWDWNINNHNSAVAFYRSIVEERPDLRLPYLYLLDNRIADRRADEAEAVLAAESALADADPVIDEVYRAHIALIRCDGKKAEEIMRRLLSAYPDDSRCLFEAAQYYAGQCDYPRAIALYERSFEKETRRPRFSDELDAIKTIYELTGDRQKAAETCDRLLDLLKNEWHMTEDTQIGFYQSEKRRLLEASGRDGQEPAVRS